ncbi:asparaginase [Nocardia sp. CDC159]|uniref:Asparaginase n=1 Tax=Nocardia pulmonis TaxID=2951408 RepID=A0A9X2E6B6_9NOCA|nr:MULTISPECIES: asparaginase [Nocardia]MCM6774456.1 asparaginase [Nocardia pulmonis]MCM6787478.1 asparaginase [Nocardia sp. CDC159]
MSQERITRRVIVFGLGGTIAMSTTATGGVAPALSAEQLLAAVPGLASTGIIVEVADFRQLPGASLTFADITALVDAITEHLPDIDGVVVTQGTDTIEETAYLIDLLHTAPHPVVVTGAMRNPTLAGADGPANLLAAISTAADRSARGQGCLVVLNDEIHAARRVCKTHTSSTGTFESPDGGPLGYLVEGQPRFLNRIAHRTTLPTRVDDDLYIPIHTVTLGDHEILLNAATDHIDGLVVAALGAGHVPARLVPALERLASRVPVVLASRTGAGSVLESTYGFPGSERDLIARGLLPAGYLNPLKSRILLAALLATTRDHTTLRTAIAAAGGYTNPETWPWPTDSSKDA